MSRFKTISTTLLSLSISFLSACSTGQNPIDPYEKVNRKIYAFNKAVDATMIKPPATFYNYAVCPQVKKGISNFFNNLGMLPTTANDALQGEFLQAYKSAWRFAINSTLGVAGVLDPASKMGLPHHTNDLGITLAKWGDKESPYMMLPLFGPSTFRDTAGWVFDGLFSAYPYIEPETLSMGLATLRYIDIRAELLKNDDILKEALDEYAFVRDAYLQNRQYQITGQAQNHKVSTQANEDEVLYIEDEDEEDIPNEMLVKKKSPKPSRYAKYHHPRHLRG